MSYYRQRRSALDSVLGSDPARHFIGTTAALIGIAAASAASSVASAKIQANAARDAAKIQQGGAQQGLDAARQAWAYQQNVYAPYLNAGASATNQLSSLLRPPGTPGAYKPGMSFAPPAAPPGPPQPIQGASPYGMMMPGARPPSATPPRMPGVPGQGMPRPVQNPYLLY